MKVALTGGTGFIGKELIEVSGNKFDILALTRKKIACCDSVEYNDLFDITSEDIVGCDVVIHLAGVAHSNSTEVGDYDKYNKILTKYIANEAVKANIKRFVFVSTIGANEFDSNHKYSSLYKGNLPNFYAQSKFEAEVELKKIAKKTGLEVVIIRPVLVYGKLAPGNFSLLRRLVSGLPFLPFGLVNNKKSFIAVENLVDLILLCTDHPNAAGEVFLASDGQDVSTKEFTNLIANGLGKRIIQLPIPIFFMRIAAKIVGKSAMIEQLVGDLVVDSSHTFKVLNWIPPYLPEQALKLLNRDLHD